MIDLMTMIRPVPRRGMIQFRGFRRRFPIRAALAILVIATVGLAGAADDREYRLLFTGDILLSRNVAREYASTHRSPWDESCRRLFHSADWVAGNLEGAVGLPEECLAGSAASERPCFAVPAEMTPILRAAGFSAVSLANNHGGDLGKSGRGRSLATLRTAGIEPLTFDSSPHFLEFGEVVVGIVAVSLIKGIDGAGNRIPDESLIQKLRLAPALADFVVVSIHWGHELQDWASPEQIDQAAWLIDHGADLIIGHHPHVIQPPLCIRGRPVFFSLGNHLFDQKYAITKQGLIADCRISNGTMRCRGLRTETARGSVSPAIIEGSDNAANGWLECMIPSRQPISINAVRLVPRATATDSTIASFSIRGVRDGRILFQTTSNEIASLEPARFDAADSRVSLFALERHYSPIDGEFGLRPYVYEVTDRGLQARWRGSSLAWPLIDAVILPGRPDLLCALHRGDNLVMLQPDTPQRKTMLYRWNGFGFEGADKPGDECRCREYYRDFLDLTAETDASVRSDEIPRPGQAERLR